MPRAVGALSLGTNMNQQTTPASGANGHTSTQDIFVLTDEQILEIDPEPQDVQVRRSEAEGKSAVGSDAPQAGAEAGSSTQTGAASPAISSSVATPDAAAQATAPAPFSAPDDIRALAELYPGGFTQAKIAAERARTLDEIDAAYFGAAGQSPEQITAARTQLAQRMLSENPAAFREMVFSGLRALEQAGASSAPVAQPLLTVPTVNSAAPSTAAALNTQEAHARVPAPTEHLAAYTEFEKAANADLEKSVGGAIDRALHQALPNAGARSLGLSRGGSASPGEGVRDAAPLQARLSQAIREDVEQALRSDRQLGDQVAQLLAVRRFDNETRAQVVRLINDRAQQLVPSAAKRALNDWTQATLAAHQARTRTANANSLRADVLPAAGQGSGPSALPANTASTARDEKNRAVSSRAAQFNSPRSPHGSRVDYRKLSDEQILDL